jgi:transposase
VIDKGLVVRFKDSMNRDALALLSKDDLIDLVLALEARLVELERRLGLNSTNSGKPPSSDGLNKPPAGRKRRTGSLRRKSGRKPGGQKGHKGETLRQVADPDATIDHYPGACPKCGLGLTPDMATGHGARQVFDLPEPNPLVVTEHRAHRCRCGRCGTEARACFPAGVTAPAQYGARIRAMVVYLQHYQLLPEDRLAELLGDLFGVSLVPATIARMGRSHARHLQGIVATIRELVKSAPVKHMDETGLRVGGRTQWLHVASTARLTFYRVSERRGSLLDGVAGIVVHDHWKPYFTMQGVHHALCNAHHLRELQALIEIEKEDWAGKMQRLLRRACHAANLARERGVAPKPSLVERFRRCWDAITAEGIRFHEAQPPLAPPPAEGRAKRRGRKPRRTGHNLLLRLQARKEDALRFLADLAVPFTNNQAEQDVRMMKVKQKISGGFRSEQGAHDFATIRGFISTAKKQDWNVIQALMQDPETLIPNLRSA